MNKTEMVNKIVERLAEEDIKVAKKSMNKYVDVMLDTIVDTMADGEDVRLTGFGNFSVVDKPERAARNPQTGETVMVAAHKAPKFKFSASVKSVIA